MGLPWDDLADAIERLQEVQRHGSPETVDAAAEVERQRERLALVGALLFDAATRPVPGVGWLSSHHYLLKGSVDRFLAISGLADRLVEVEAAADEAKRLRKENWELAVWLAELQRRIEALERERGAEKQCRGSGCQGRGEAVA